MRILMKKAGSKPKPPKGLVRLLSPTGGMVQDSGGTPTIYEPFWIIKRGGEDALGQATALLKRVITRTTTASGGSTKDEVLAAFRLVGAQVLLGTEETLRFPPTESPQSLLLTNADSLNLATWTLNALRLLESVVPSALSLGDYFDCLSEVLESCTLAGCVELAEHFASRYQFVKEQSSADRQLQLTRAKLIRITNQFDRKLKDTDLAHHVAKIRHLCTACLPMHFGGINNKKPRMRHHILAMADLEPQGNTLLSDAFDWDSIDELSDDSEVTPVAGRESRTKRPLSSGSRAGAEDDKNPKSQKKAKVAKASASQMSDYALYKAVLETAGFVQAPEPVLVANPAEGLRLLRMMGSLISHFKSTPPTPHPVKIFEHFLSKTPSRSSQSSRYPLTDLPDLIKRRLEGSSGNRDSEMIQSSYDVRLPSASIVDLWPQGASPLAFKEALGCPEFRQETMMRFHMALSGLRSPMNKAPPLPSPSSAATAASPIASTSDSTPLGTAGYQSALDTMSPEIKLEVIDLCDRLYRMLKTSSIFIGHGLHNSPSVIPSASSARYSGGGGRPPLIRSLASIVGESVNQEALMVKWKRDGCLDISQQPQRGLNTTASATTPLTFPTEGSLSSPFAIYEKNRMPAQFSALQKRRTALLRKCLPALSRLEKCGELRQQGDSIAPLSFTREREDWFLSSPAPPKDYLNQSVSDKLLLKWSDYKDKVVMDDDPENQVEDQEKAVKDSLFQWRCHRLLNVHMLHFYDSNQSDRDLRTKIREGDIEDLIQTVAKRACTNEMPTEVSQ